MSCISRAPFRLAAACCLILLVQTTGFAQIVNIPAGVEVDADGVLHTKIFPDPTGELTRQRINAAKAMLPPDVVRVSELRKISLQRLEAAVAERLQAGLPLTDEMKQLAGMTRITHVFYYPETKDIVVAGPAEGFFTDLSGRVVGLNSGRAILNLEDLIVALRAFPASGERTSVISCSIDPTQEGLQKMQESYRAIQGSFRPGDEANVVAAFRDALGQQNVTIKGVPATSHFAQVLVEADYRMKLIGIGLEQPPVNIPSFVEKVNPRAVASNALQRWYFTPDYDCVRVSADEMAMQLVGNGAKLVGADELVRGDGVRVKSGNQNRASRAFCNAFTEKFAALADKSPVYAELRNLIDMSIAAAFIQKMDYYGQAEWSMPLFGNEAQLPVEVHTAPTKAEPAINAIWKDNLFMTPIGGGVAIQPRLALDEDHLRYDERGDVEKLHQQVRTDGLGDGHWWWD